MAANTPYTTSGWVVNSRGPGWTPWTIRPPSSIAVAASPGMPKVSKGSWPRDGGVIGGLGGDYAVNNAGSKFLRGFDLF